MEDEEIGLVAEPEKVYNIKHRAYLFAKSVVLFVSSLKYDKIYYSILDQLMRSSTSIGANLVEGRAGASKNDFVNFHAIALKSGNETKYWLCLVRDTMDVDKKKIVELINEADEITKIIASIIISTRK
jgi:four helix bundle protein